MLKIENVEKTAEIDAEMECFFTFTTFRSESEFWKRKK